MLEAGEGGRPLLLSHGFTGAKEDFGDWLDAFADEGWWVVAPDLRGHGASEQPAEEGHYSLGHFATDLLALADDLGWDRFSHGRPLDGRHGRPGDGAAGPERIERLVLMDTHHGPVEGIDSDTVALAVDILRTEGIAGAARR